LPHLLAIIEVGGYPDFTPDYRKSGYEVMVVHSMRKARTQIKKQPPDVIVVEFNFQSDFRDRTSTLETLMASLQHENINPKVIVFYEKEFLPQFGKVTGRFEFYKTFAFPIDKQQLMACLDEIR